MTSEEARHYLRNRGRTSCSCKYGSIEKMIEEAIRLQEIEKGNKKTQP